MSEHKLVDVMSPVVGAHTSVSRYIYIERCDDMTELAHTTTLDGNETRPRALRTLTTGLLGGLALGIIARAWMRLIAEDPAFTWSGTIFIVIGFTIFGFTQSIVAIARRRARRRWALTTTRAIGTVGLLPLFVAAGSVMLPTIVSGGFAYARPDWRRARWGCVVVAAGPVVLVGSGLVRSFGWSLHTAAGFLMMLAVYGTIIRASRFTFGAPAHGRHIDRRLKIAGLVALPPFLFFIAGRVFQ